METGIYYLLPRLISVAFDPQYETHPYLPQPELLSFCRKQDICVMAYAPLGMNALLSDPTIISIANKYSVDPAKVLVSRAVQRGTCVVLRSSDAKHMAENLSLIKLDHEDLELLGTMKTRARYISPLELFGVDLFGESDHGYEEQGPKKVLAPTNSVHLAI
jgi:diketogulonate reductase-like aldo/keto reductase